MKSLVFGIGIFAVGFVAATPACADYAVVRFADGYCRIWRDSAATPWGAGWTKIAIAPDWLLAHAALDTALANHICN